MYKGSSQLENRGYLGGFSNSTGKFFTSYFSQGWQSTSNGKSVSSACGGIWILWDVYDSVRNQCTPRSEANTDPFPTRVSPPSGWSCREVWQRGRLCHQVRGPLNGLGREVKRSFHGKKVRLGGRFILQVWVQWSFNSVFLGGSSQVC